MNTTNQHNTTPAGHCSQTFFFGGRKVVNTYKCDQRPFSSADLWSIQRTKHTVAANSPVLESVL